MDQRLRALNRFGLGARIGERRGLSDPRGWLEEQLGGPVERPADVPAEERIWSVLGSFLDARRERDRDAIREGARAMREIVAAEGRAVLDLRVASDRPFVERLVAFWSNHLCVSVAGEPLVAPLAGLYERQAIRPHVLGRFEDMVLASAAHPAMLVYLDNFRSVGPGSVAARRVGRRLDRELGLNENHARELLELHTLGVDGGYGQEDVVELARLLTGWTVPGLRGGRLDRGRERGFAFRPVLHEPGPKTVLGERYGEGEAEGRRAIRDLCRHPSTAAFVARKLVTHFVADDPPAPAVEAVARTFRETGGDLRAVAGRLVSLEEAWDPEALKLRTPQDWLVALFRAVGLGDAPEPTAGLLRQLRHTLWAPGAPKGYGDTEREWADPDSLMNRAELARSAARRASRGGLDPRRLLEVMEVADGDPLPDLLADEAIDRAERVALAVGGPAFQWR